MVSRKENKMNLLRTLWGWLTSLFAEAPAPAIEEQECCEEVCEVEEECCDHEDCEPAPEPIIEIHAKEEPTPVVVEEVEIAPQESPLTASELIRDLLLSEGATERQIEKFEIEKRFQKWYQGELTPAAVRESVPSFKAEVPACWISPKLNKVI
jgi:hypothetical protein